MTSQLSNIVPIAPLTDQVFPFNQPWFLAIRSYQQSDLGFLQSSAVKAIIAAGDTVGSAAAGIAPVVGTIATGTASALSGTTEQAAAQLVDPFRTVTEHITASNSVNNNLPAAVNAVDNSIYTFSNAIGTQCPELYGNIGTQGVQIITTLQGYLADIDTSLLGLINVLTGNNLQENLQIVQDQYQAINIPALSQNFVGGIASELPSVLATTNNVQAAFRTILANFTLAKSKISSGITDPTKIFAQNQEQVVADWLAFETSRRTMTYLPFNH
jgi:hypothetical protein